MKSSIAKKIYIVVAALVIWFGLCLQFNVSLNLLNHNYPATIKLFLSYFTVTTNIILAFCFTSIWLFRLSGIGLFFAKPATLTAITVYILVVGLIYNLMLRGIVEPKGWARVADELLHVVNPIICFVFWLFFINKSNLRYKYALGWLIYPLLYVVFIVIRGYFITQYPYPFIDVVVLGYPKAILNTVIVLIVFWILSILLIWIGKKTAKD